MSPKVVEATLSSGINCGDGYQLIHPTIAPFRVLLFVAKPIKNNMGDICKILDSKWLTFYNPFFKELYDR
jgi:hypothetical protein